MNSGEAVFQLSSHPDIDRIVMRSPIPGDINYLPGSLGAQYHQGMCCIFFHNNAIEDKKQSIMRIFRSHVREGRDKFLGEACHKTKNEQDFVGAGFMGDININKKVLSIIDALQSNEIISKETAENAKKALHIAELDADYSSPSAVVSSQNIESEGKSHEQGK